MLCPIFGDAGTSPWGAVTLVKMNWKLKWKNDQRLQVFKKPSEFLRDALLVTNPQCHVLNLNPILILLWASEDYTYGGPKAEMTGLLKPNVGPIRLGGIEVNLTLFDCGPLLQRIATE